MERKKQQARGSFAYRVLSNLDLVLLVGTFNALSFWRITNS